MATISQENRDRELTDDNNDLQGLTDYTIRNKIFSHDEDGDILHLTNCVDVRIIGCTFKDKHTQGNFIDIDGANTKRIFIENCTFKNHTFGGENGGEAIILGRDNLSGCKFETTIRNCEFINCRGDPETISVKSAGNLIEYNCIKNNSERGMISVRHGGRATIQNNVFEGSFVGIKILGCGNKILGNYHKDNSADEDKRRPLIIQLGDSDKDPNFSDDCIPNDHEGEKAKYAKAVDNIIEGNIYENCKGPCVVWGWQYKPDHTKRPKANKFRNNTLIADEVDSEFLVFRNRGEDDRFENNQMWGRRANRGDLPEDLVRLLDERPNITIPDTPCRRS